MKTTITLEQIPDFVTTNLMPLLKTKRIFTLTGPLGAGKTTLTKEFLRQCGITKTVTSPTFSYVNTYTNVQGCTFYHFDLYRLGSVDDFITMGFDEYLNQPNSFCLIEWPEVIAPLLKSFSDQISAIKLMHNPEDQSKRSITLD